VESPAIQKSRLQAVVWRLQTVSRFLEPARIGAFASDGSTRFMSQHNSLRATGTTGAKRNVLKRFERVALLKSRSQWKDGDRVSGLRKTKPPE
jgi:small basic protein (TIGR04137 family)